MSRLSPDEDPRNELVRAGRWIAPLLALALTVLPNPVTRASTDALLPPHDATKAAPPEPPPGGVAVDDQGKGLTLDEAVERLKRDNLTLRALELEVPQARADITSAAQQPNSLFLVGDGRTSPRFARLQPLDLIPKRWARVLTARLAARVTAAQYRDAVRLQTDSLYTVFVNVQATRQQVRFARANHDGVEKLLEITRLLYKGAAVGKDDVDRLVAEQSRAAAALADAEVALTRAKLTLADLMNLTDVENDRLEVVDLTDENPSEIPAVEGLIRIARHSRPDLIAYRLGLLRACSEWLTTWVEQFPDLYVLYPSNPPENKGLREGVIAPQRVPSLLVILPDAGHQRGKVLRARINIDQSRIELARVEKQVTLEVRQAHLESQQSLNLIQEFKNKVLPSARQVRDDAFRRFQGGEVDARGYLDAQKDYNDVIRQYGEAVIRYRRSALALNTAVGERVLP